MTQAQRAVPAHHADPEWTRTRVLDGRAVSRVLTRLAHEIVEGHPGDMDRVVLAGIREGGVGVARELCAHLRGMSAPVVTLVAVDVSGFRDDRPRQPGLDGGWQAIPPPTGATGPDPSPEGAVVILVDDVIQTGRTMRAAFDVVSTRGRPASIEMAVLVDRGGREVPVRPNYVGKNLPVTAGDWVEIEFGPGPDGGGIFLVPHS